MKILILNASPKPLGTISQMLKFLEDEIRRKNPSAEIENIRVSSLKFSACTGCMKCRSCGKCVFAGDDADVAGEKNCKRRFSCCGFSVLVGQHDRQLEVAF